MPPLFSFRRKVIASAVVIVLLFFGISAYQSNHPTFKTLNDYQRQTPHWSSCYDAFECSSIKVPIDYNNIATGSFTLQILRHRATDASNRIGSLVVNPGGPGASGFDYAYNAESIVSKAVLERYDIVGFDPRGVGKSVPIHCLNDKETDASYASDSKPDSAQELAQLVQQAKTYVAKCEANTPYLASFSTANAARDMDVLRSALGDKKLNYLGKSYGTYLGTLYAQFFPQNVGRIVLDGAIDPQTSAVQQSITQAIGFDHALSAFIDDCYTRKDCPLAKPSKKALEQVIKVFHDASATPWHSTSGRAVTDSLIVLGSASALYDNEWGWPKLRLAFSQAKLGEGSTFLTLADGYTQRNSDGTYNGNESDAGAVIDCLDWPDARTTAQVQADSPDFAKQAPVFGPYLAYNALVCHYFPRADTAADSMNSSSATRNITSSPIMIIGTTRDPATPYEWARGLHKEIAGSRLLTLDADGHTGHGRGSTCIDSAVDAYLLKSSIPVKDLFCSL
ncbi:MAG: alpha/beta hydrolase [Actinomycetales bacterium]|nr:MAG: alpha/beta hydrolase [Actinomycetales bacterium]